MVRKKWFSTKYLAYYQVISFIVLALSFIAIGSLPKEMRWIQTFDEVILPKWEVFQIPLVLIFLISLILLSILFGFKRGVRYGLGLVKETD